MGEKKIVNVGRIAGKYAILRTWNTEVINGVEVSGQRIGMVSSCASLVQVRKHNKGRMLEGYFHSTATLNLVRAFRHGCYARLVYMNSWSNDTFRDFRGNEK